MMVVDTKTDIFLSQFQLIKIKNKQNVKLVIHIHYSHTHTNYNGFGNLLTRTAHLLYENVSLYSSRPPVLNFASIKCIDIVKMVNMYRFMFTFQKFIIHLNFKTAKTMVLQIDTAFIVQICTHFGIQQFKIVMSVIQTYFEGNSRLFMTVKETMIHKVL